MYSICNKMHMYMPICCIVLRKNREKTRTGNENDGKRTFPAFKEVTPQHKILHQCP